MKKETTVAAEELWAFGFTLGKKIMAYVSGM